MAATHNMPTLRLAAESWRRFFPTLCYLTLVGGFTLAEGGVDLIRDIAAAWRTQ
jgi:hypothetical protein